MICHTQVGLLLYPNPGPRRRRIFQHVKLAWHNNQYGADHIGLQLLEGGYKHVEQTTMEKKHSVITLSKICQEKKVYQFLPHLVCIEHSLVHQCGLDSLLLYHLQDQHLAPKSNFFQN